jgi:large subunit ribosomal protein L32
MSKAKTNTRRSQWKSAPPTYAECPQCHQPKLPHRVCANCGYYGGRQVIEVE